MMMLVVVVCVVIVASGGFGSLLEVECVWSYKEAGAVAAAVAVVAAGVDSRMVAGRC
jgi:hypothetical protein